MNTPKTIDNGYVDGVHPSRTVVLTFVNTFGLSQNKWTDYLMPLTGVPLNIVSSLAIMVFYLISTHSQFNVLSARSH